MLRNHLPKQLRDRKPSKAETLKSAAQYISHLLRILEKEIENSSNNLKDEHQKGDLEILSEKVFLSIDLKI